MNAHSTIKEGAAALIKRDASFPALIETGPRAIGIVAGTRFRGHLFRQYTPVDLQGELVAGADYGVTLAGGAVRAWRATAIPSGEDVIGGFHFAPGGNATARSGGDDVPAINPYSIWDLNFRPACPDPRGMALVQKPGGRFWCDIYLTGADHLAAGTSRFGVTIADGKDLPADPSTGGRFQRFDYATAVAVMAHHGKGLLSLDEFPHAFFGVTERTAAKRDPKVTGLDAARTSKFGIMQATGNLWVWGHDGDPDKPRPSIFGGSWWSGGPAGSRYASVGSWAGNSYGSLGARGRSDHLQLVGRRGSDGVAA